MNIYRKKLNSKIYNSQIAIRICYINRGGLEGGYPVTSNHLKPLLRFKPPLKNHKSSPDKGFKCVAV